MGNSLDNSVVIEELLATLLAFILAYITYKIGKASGFWNVWKIVAVGYALIPLRQLLLVLDQIFPIANEYGLVDVSNGLTVALLVLHVWGFWKVLKVFQNRRENNG